MKRLVILLMILAAVLCGCGGGKEVPETLIALEVEKFVNEKGISDPYSVEISQYYDETSKIVTVNVELRAEYAYAQGVYRSRYAYQYNRSSDTWDMLYDFGWSERETVYLPEAYIGTFIGYFSGSDEYRFRFDIDEIDFENDIMVCDYVLDTERGMIGGSDVIDISNDSFDIVVNGYCYKFFFTPGGGILGMDYGRY